MPDKETQQSASGRSLAKREVVQAQEAEIHSVTVYRDRAEVKRSVRVRVEAGENEVVVSGLPECTDKDSIRVEGLSESAEKVIITDVIYSTENKTLNEEREEEGEGEGEGGKGEGEGSKGEYERLKGVIKEKEKELKHLQFRSEALVKEKGLLQQFAGHVARVSSGKPKGEDEEGSGQLLPHLLEGGALGAVLEFMQRYQEKLGQLDSRKLEVEGQRSKLTEEVKVMRAKADKLNPAKKDKDTESVRSVSISLESGVACDVHLKVSYVVSCAAWSSSYDVRVFTKDKTMKVQYYGLIKQWTGEDWKDASISLSTAQPSIGGSAPDLPTRIIRFWRPPPPPANSMYNRRNETRPSSVARVQSSDEHFGTMKRLKRLSMQIDAELELQSEQLDRIECGSLQANTRGGLGGGFLPPGAPPPVAVQTTQVEAGLFSTTFNIPRKTTIPADKTEHKVTVALIDLAPEFRYVSVPRLSPYSFLQASATNKSSYTLLAGPANVFLDNNFIAKSELSDVSAGEQFTSSLGADQAIRITCQPVAVVHSTTRGLSKNKVLTYTHAIKVKNTKEDEVKIEVSEQVPLSTDDRIKVQVLVPDVKKTGVKAQLPYGHAVLNEAHNVEWHATMAASTELELKLVYSVEHPPHDRVDGLPKV